MNANAKVLQGVVLQAKKLGKSIYIFSADAEGTKVAHVNAVSEDAKAKGLDGREWALAVTAILGGKVRSQPRYPRTFCWRLTYAVSDRLAASQMVLRASGQRWQRCKMRWRPRGNSSCRRRPAELLQPEDEWSRVHAYGRPVAVFT